MGTRFPRLTGALASLLIAQAAQAHIPIFPDGAGDSPETAVFIDDSTISHAVYGEITEALPRLWITFEAEAGQELYVQIGIPVFDELEDFRPAIALLGPGLPAVELPFDIPAGLGGVILDSTGGEPEFFHERYTGTDSWILGEIAPDAPETGTYYVVAYVPNGDTGKLWVAPGRLEVFEPQDIVALPQAVLRVRDYHGVAVFNELPCFLPAMGVGFLLFAGLRFVRGNRSRTD